MEREAKQRERESLKREGQGGAREQESANCYRGGAGGDRGGAESVQSTDSNPFADRAERPAKERQSSRDRGAGGTEHGDGGGGEGWDGHYSPEEKAHCSHCGRRFVLERLDTHMDICGKVQGRKRKVYDSAQKRAKGTDLENYQCSRKVLPMPKVNWKKKHDCFIRMLRAAQQVELEIYRSRKVAQAAPGPDLVQCPHCSRRFQPASAEAHIPKCKILRSRPSPPRR